MFFSIVKKLLRRAISKLSVVSMVGFILNICLVCLYLKIIVCSIKGMEVISLVINLFFGLLCFLKNI